MNILKPIVSLGKWLFASDNPYPAYTKKTEELFKSVRDRELNCSDGFEELPELYNAQGMPVRDANRYLMKLVAHHITQLKSKLEVK